MFPNHNLFHINGYVPISPVSHGLTHTPGSQCLPLSLHLQLILSTYYSPVELESSYFFRFSASPVGFARSLQFGQK